MAKTKLAAILYVGAEMGSSVKTVFGGITKQINTLGRSMESLRSKESLAFKAMDQERAIKKQEAELNRLVAIQKKAQTAAANGGAADQRTAAKATAAVEKQIKAVDQEYAAMHKLDEQLKQNEIDSSKLDQETQRLGGAIVNMDRRMAVGGHMQKLGSALGGVGSAMKSLALQAGVVGGAVGYLFKSQFLDEASGFEVLRTRLRTVSKSSADAQASFQWLTNFEPTTPFQIDDVTEAFVKLKNIGLDPVNTGLMQTVGNTAAAFGEKNMTRPIDALTSAVFRGRFTMLGGYGIGAHAVGKPGSGQEELSWFDSQGKKKTAIVDKHNQMQVVSTIQAIWNEKYGSAMDRFMQTWEGMMSSLATQWELFKVEIMNDGLFDFMKGKLGDLLDFIKKARKDGDLSKWAKEIGDGFKTTGQDLWDFGVKAVKAWEWVDSAFQPLLGDGAALKITLGLIAAIQLAPLVIACVQLGTALVGIGGAAITAMGGLAMVCAYGTGLALIAAAAYNIYNHFDSWVMLFDDIGGAIKTMGSIFGNMFAAVLNAAEAVFDAFKGFFTGDFTDFNKDIDNLCGHFLAAIKEMGDAWNGVKSFVNDGLLHPVTHSGPATQAELDAARAQSEANRIKYGIPAPRAGTIRSGGPLPMPASGSTGNKTINSSPTYNININAPTTDNPAKVAAETKARLEMQHEALLSGALFD